ncbi:unnamed protein product [Amoebophrya sp. A25]|nr:unnamed protein product [Amoebophrya sp. A25]|eukprot:GSA25T00024497001.1
MRDVTRRVDYREGVQEERKKLVEAQSEFRRWEEEQQRMYVETLHLETIVQNREMETQELRRQLKSLWAEHQVLMTKTEEKKKKLWALLESGATTSRLEGESRMDVEGEGDETRVLADPDPTNNSTTQMPFNASSSKQNSSTFLKKGHRWLDASLDFLEKGQLSLASTARAGSNSRRGTSKGRTATGRTAVVQESTLLNLSPIQLSPASPGVVKNEG